MEVKCETYVKPAEVTTQLEALRLSEEDLAWAVRYGDEQAGSSTENDPRVLKNFTRWGKTFRGLADRLSGDWKHEERRCFPLMVKGDDSIALTVSSGDSQTGRPGPMPRTRNPKGPVTRQVVIENTAQLPGMDTTVTYLRRDEGGPQTWFLLYHVDRETGEIRAELSLAAGMSESGTVAEWFKRIILTAIPGSPQAPIEEDEEDIDITIQRRGV